MARFGLNENVPCYKCQKRHVGCHDHCEDYLKYREKLDKKNAQERDEKERYFLGFRLGGKKHGK